MKQREIDVKEILRTWGRALLGNAPMLSIEVTRECPLSCPGCYAYGDNHLGGETTLSSVADYRGDELVSRVLALVDKHQPMHVSLVGGEPLVRHRELSRILPELSRRGIYTLVVTSGIIPIPEQWAALRRVIITVSVDGLPEHHDVRRKPATYERLLKNLAGRKFNIHLTITRPMLQRPGYLDEYFDFWSARPELQTFWISTYTPQRGEDTPEMLRPRDREFLLSELPRLNRKFPKLLMNPSLIESFAHPPQSPRECIFSSLSVNYTADLRSRVEPCIFGGDPDCSQCGCSASMGLHAIGKAKLVGGLRAGHILYASIATGRQLSRLRRKPPLPERHIPVPEREDALSLVQIER